MKKNTFVLISVLILLGVVIYLISNFSYTPENKLVPVENKVESLESKIEDLNDFYTISALYPNEILDKNKVIEAFVKNEVNQKKEEWKIGGEVYNEEQKTSKEFPDRPKMKYEFNLSYKKYESSNLGTVSYVFTIYEYTGGANGNIRVNTFTFNNDGQVLIDNILNFTDNNNDIALTKILAEKAMSNKDDSFIKDMLYTGLGLDYLKSDGITIDKKKCDCDGFFFPSNFQNFFIKDKGITFIFNKYQISAGVAGTPEISMDWDSLSPYFTNEFKSIFSPQKNFTVNLIDFQNIKIGTPYSDIQKQFGPAKDIGSGLYIFIYTLGDKSQVMLGFADLNSLMYIKHKLNNGVVENIK